ncbi:MAG: hypothetical protein DLM58_01490 [Pseudonocardiales bacterium]|nr:MAG: hypothetical protein DLM58_01490 [Pseudonocardiales bacterium]
MSLHDADIADLAREAVDQKDPQLEIRIHPLGQNDPYRLGAEAWTVSAGGSTSYITASMTWRQALDKLIAELAT